MIRIIRFLISISKSRTTTMRLAIILVIFLNTPLLSQNLVPNPSFEEVKDTVSRFTKDNNEFIQKIKFWTSPNNSSPDLITPDFKEKYISQPKARTGDNIIGIQSEIDWSEYISIRLNNRLIPGKTYYVEYYIRRASCLRPSMNVDQEINSNFGILFTKDEIIAENGIMLIGSPQIISDKSTIITNSEWIKISNYFTPKSDFLVLNLGQFKTEKEDLVNLRGYYVIDDVSVTELEGISSLDKNVDLPKGSIIPLPNLNFKSGSTELRDHKSFETLQELILFLKQNNHLKFQINGHTDSVGKSKLNL